MHVGCAGPRGRDPHPQRPAPAPAAASGAGAPTARGGSAPTRASRARASRSCAPTRGAECRAPSPSWDEYAETVRATGAAAGEFDDYTFIWWDVRAHPRLGTVELREIDVQSSLEDSAALAALVQGLAARALESPGADELASEAIAESSFRASRDGVEATILHDGELRPLRDVARATCRVGRRPRARARLRGRARGNRAHPRARAEAPARQRAAARAAAVPRSCSRCSCATPRSTMARLILGPMLRYLDECSATVWVETDAPCEVEVLGPPGADLLRRGPPLRDRADHGPRARRDLSLRGAPRRRAALAARGRIGPPAEPDPHRSTPIAR